MIARFAPLVALLSWACTVSAGEPARSAPHASGPGASTFVGRLSPVEEAFSERTGEPLTIFGAGLFAGSEPPAPSSGAVGGDYRLGIGDALTVSLRGRVSFSKRFLIDSAGQILIDDLRPITAAGLTLDALRAEIDASVGALHRDTDAFVSLAEVRRIGVLVAGEVARPGVHQMTAFSTVLDALNAAGGVAPHGSLRKIRLLRHGAPHGAPSDSSGGSSGGGTVIDLYDLLLAGGGGNAGLRLRDGDTLFVPTLGDTVAVAGPVKRPHVFELPQDQTRLSVRALTDLAGGVIRPGAHRALRLFLRPTGEETAEEVADREAPLLGNGDILVLSPAQENRRGLVRLDGHVIRPGPRALREAPTLARLVGRADLAPAPYLPFAILAGQDRNTGTVGLRAVDLSEILNGRDDRALAEEDVLYVLGAEEVDFLSSEPVLALLRGSPQPPPKSCAGLVMLARTLSAAPRGTLADGAQARAAATMTGARGPCPPLFDRVPDLLVFALEHSELRRGGGGRPGFHPVAGNMRHPGRTHRPGVRGGSGVLDGEEPRYEIRGHARHPGVRSLEGGVTLRDALSGGDEALPGVYPLFAVLERFDRRTLTPSLIPFSPQEVATRGFDRVLSDHDVIHLFSARQIRALMDEPEDERKEPETPDPESKVPPEGGKPRTTKAAPGEAPMRGKSVQAPPSPTEPPEDGIGDAVSEPAIARLIQEHGVWLRGHAQRPGNYPVAVPTPLESIIAAAGGLSVHADPSAIETNSASGRRTVADLRSPGTGRLLLGPGDSVRIAASVRIMEGRSVTIEGQVNRPGEYDIQRGETLSSLIERAGGLTEVAYPAGTILTRESEQRRIRGEQLETAMEVDRWLATNLQKGEGVKPEQIARAQLLSAKLHEAKPDGRIVVESDPAVLAARPELDMLLEAGDRVVIPKRPLSVAVSGEVLNTGSFQFVSGKTAEDYLRDAGGLTREADHDRIYLKLPNGAAQPLALSSWNHTVTVVPPGSVIVVTRDPEPFEFLELSKSIGGILSQLAITAASISVIAD
ncbi:SLBB domain-containing protein [Azospirillum sp. SYSU D00513]|uniref:SLBB domain-containing protein n=1 Tax=Azospirillum sp. SYSU D00513 TaxID=2812561 RepID=UPI001A96723E|nr:SLBB domain-containing protein [Azospirillum sp. SYSU D00513]